jgi:hypothetical protein
VDGVESAVLMLAEGVLGRKATAVLVIGRAILSARSLDPKVWQRVPMAKDGLIADVVARNEPTILAQTPAPPSIMTYRFVDLLIVC